ncbi:hypothetical protein RP20_CCG022284 [Aedes albopictus]|nr:hypothetical protein RP20_CCG022284 [Aedes albopictus]
MLSDRVVIPDTLRTAVLKQLHAGHPGMERMKGIARSYVFWPNIDVDIEDYVRRCPRCAAVAKSPGKTTLSSWPIPMQPWSRIHMDYAGPFKGKYFLVIVDALTKWPEIYCTNSMTASVTVSKLRETTARFGLPDVIVTDNGTQFDSSLFGAFCEKNGIEHIKIPPFHPQSNGQAERFVDTLKRALRKMDGDGLEEALQTFLFTYRYTPNKSVQGMKSPAEAMLGRKLKMNLDLLKKPAPKSTNINRQQNEQFNRVHGAKERTFTDGEEVYAEIYIRNKRHWALGKIIERKGSVTYNVFLDDERRRGLIRSHANQLRPRYDGNPVNPDENQESLPVLMLLEEFGIHEKAVETVQLDPEPEQPIAISDVQVSQFEEPVVDVPERLVNNPVELEEYRNTTAASPSPALANVVDSPGPSTVVKETRTRRFPAFFKDYSFF